MRNECVHSGRSVHACVCSCSPRCLMCKTYSGRESERRRPDWFSSNANSETRAQTVDPYLKCLSPLSNSLSVHPPPLSLSLLLSFSRKHFKKKTAPERAWSPSIIRRTMGYRSRRWGVSGSVSASVSVSIILIVHPYGAFR